ncbi:18.5 kDa class I heat shock protein-like [Arachis hypogaea]|uniref:18.5 kDa class I heat shock protein-like n=2 Tax=Arachis TaxID=3817 RepID=UPI0007AF3190|nr:class I heat shock protein-like [Arachis hypogaea]
MIIITTKRKQVKKDGHVFLSDLPSLKKDEVKVEVNDGRVLQISGDRHAHDEDHGHKNKKMIKWHRVEQCGGKFQRRFRLPENAKVEQVKAHMENGVLVVTVPKQELKKPNTKLLQIHGN